MLAFVCLLKWSVIIWLVWHEYFPAWSFIRFILKYYIYPCQNFDFHHYYGAELWNVKLHEPFLVLQAGQPGSVKLARKQENHKSDIRREDFSFKSKSTPPQCNNIIDIIDIIANIKFRSVKDAFQKTLKEDISNITVTKCFCHRRQNR